MGTEKIKIVKQKIKISKNIRKFFSIFKKAKRINFKFKIKKPTWRFKLNLNNKFFKKSFAAITILAVLVMVYFQGTPQAQAATFTLFETDWSGGVGATAVHNPTGGQTTITTYSTKDTNLNLANGGADLQFLTTTGSPIIQTNDGATSTGFNLTGKTLDQTEVNGTGDGAAIKLSTQTAASTMQTSTGDSHSCAVSETGYAYCWGKNDNNQLGDNTTTVRDTPVRVLKGAAVTGDNDGTYLINIKSIIAGNNQTCAVSNNNNVYCWGYNGYGQLGDGTTTLRATPIRVLKGAAVSGDNDGTNLTNVKSVTVGNNQTCAVSNNNNVYCWGYNNYGQLGDNTTNQQNTPVRVLKGAAASGDNDGTNLTNVKSVFAGGAHTCAVSNNNNTYCWGYNSYGQLGDNTTTARYTPVRVLKGEAATGDNDGTNLTNVKSVTAGGVHTCAVSEAGNAYCWGYNNNRQLGNHSYVQSATPVRVADLYSPTFLSNMVQISAGSAHTCAVSGTGSVYCWGDNGNGQLGDNTTTARYTPSEF
ncbi:MAG: hypothetical protein WCX17_02060 [Parcubacteria group bacterium]|jgi:alpha-tubulin suppressor-like RCC1 family protein